MKRGREEGEMRKREWRGMRETGGAGYGRGG